MDICKTHPHLQNTTAPHPPLCAWSVLQAGAVSLLPVDLRGAWPPFKCCQDGQMSPELFCPVGTWALPCTARQGASCSIPL